MMMQRLRDEVFIRVPGGGRVSVLDLWSHVRNNPQLKALAERDPNLAAPAGGRSRCVRQRAAVCVVACLPAWLRLHAGGVVCWLMLIACWWCVLLDVWGSHSSHSCC